MPLRAFSLAHAKDARCGALGQEGDRTDASQAILQGRKADAVSVAGVPAIESGRERWRPRDRCEGSIETQIIRRVSDRPHAAVDGAALASSPGDLEPRPR